MGRWEIGDHDMEREGGREGKSRGEHPPGSEVTGSHGPATGLVIGVVYYIIVYLQILFG
jgi:hypothetical protein